MRCVVERSLALGTALTPKIGYDAAAGIVREAFSTRKTVLQVSPEHRVLPEDELKRLLDPKRLTKHRLFGK